MSNSWRLVCLGSVATVIAGQSPAGENYNKNAKGLPFYQGKKEFGPKFLGPATTWTTQVTKEAEAGDILMSVRAPVGPINFSTQRICIGRGLAAIRSGTEIDHEFLFYALTHKQEEISGNEGAVFASINKRQIESISIALPPLPEQKRIVAILDEAFAGIDTAIANTEKNLVNVRELFESKLNSAFQQPEADWQEKCLSEIAYSVSTGPFGSLLHKSDYVCHGVPLVNPINIVSGEIVPDTNKMVGDETQQRLSAYTLQQGDIVIARRGEIGRCAVVKPHQEGWVCGTGCFFIRPKMVVHPEFIAHLIRSHDYRKELERQSSGTTMANLSNTTLSNFRISIPPLTKQHLILDQIADLQQQCRQVETIYQQKLNALAELKQSLLQKAFAGELTARAIQQAEDTAA